MSNPLAISSAGKFSERPAEKPSDRSQRVAAALAAFRNIVLPYPRQQMLMAELDELRLVGLATKGQPQNGLRLLAPTGSGKTVTARQYASFVAAQPHRVVGSRPVLIVPLEVTGTPRSLFSSILTALGDSYSCNGTEQILKRRVLKAFELEQTELLIIDEVQHLNNRASVGNDVTDTLKRFLDDGVLPIAFVGTDAATSMFGRNPELNGRLAAPCSLPPLDWLDQGDRELFHDFVSALDEALVDEGIFPLISHLAEDELLQNLFKASNGIIGQLMGIMFTATRLASRNRAECLEWADLADAVDAWSTELGFLDYNPFRSPR